MKIGILEIGKLEFQKLGIEFRNRNFEELFKDGILKTKINKIITTTIIIN